MRQKEVLMKTVLFLILSVLSLHAYNCNLIYCKGVDIYFGEVLNQEICINIDKSETVLSGYYKEDAENYVSEAIQKTIRYVGYDFNLKGYQVKFEEFKGPGEDLSSFYIYPGSGSLYLDDETGECLYSTHCQFYNLTKILRQL